MRDKPRQMGETSETTKTKETSETKETRETRKTRGDKERQGETSPARGCRVQMGCTCTHLSSGRKLHLVRAIQLTNFTN